MTWLIATCIGSVGCAVAQTVKSPQAQTALAEARRLSDQVVRLSQEGKYDEAIPLAERNLELVEKILGPNDPNVVAAMTNLIALHQAKRNIGKADKYAERAQAILNRATETDPLVTAQLLLYLSNYYAAKEDYKKAELLCQTALTKLEQGVGPQHSSLGVVLVSLAELASKLKKPEQAEAMYQRALTIAEKASKNDHSDVVEVLSRFAGFYQERKDYGKAEALYQRALVLQEEMFGAGHLKLVPLLDNLAILYIAQKQFGQAESLYTRALKISEIELGATHQQLIAPLRNLAGLYAQVGEVEKALSLVQRALVITGQAGEQQKEVRRWLQKDEKTLLAARVRGQSLRTAQGAAPPPEPPTIYKEQIGSQRLPVYDVNTNTQAAATNHRSQLSKLSSELYDQVFELIRRRNYTEAIDVAKSELAIKEKMYGADDPLIAWSLETLADLYRRAGDFRQSESLSQRALSIREKKLGAQHVETARSLQNLAQVSFAKGDYAKAEVLYQRALTIFEKTPEQNTLSLLLALTDLANLENLKGEIGQAEALYLRGLTFAEKTQKKDDSNVPWLLTELSTFYNSRGEFLKAEQYRQQAIAAQEKIRASLSTRATDKIRSADLSLASLLVEAADDHVEKGNYSQAQALYQRAQTIYEKTSGPEGLEVAEVWSKLGRLCGVLGEPEQGEKMLQRAVVIYERTFGPEHNAVANILDHYVALYLAQQNYTQAEQVQQRIVKIYQKTYGTEHAFLFFPLSSLASIVKVRGDYAQAELYYQQVLRLVEKAFGAEHLYIAMTKYNLALLSKAQKDFARAEKLLQQAQQITEKVYRLDSPFSIFPLGELADTNRRLKNYEQAEQQYLRVLEVHEKAQVTGKYPQMNLPALIGLAEVCRLKKDLPKAEPLYQRALTILEKDRRQDAPDSVWVLDSYAAFCREKGDLAQATALLARSNAIRERSIRLNLGVGSEQQKFLFLSTFTERLNATISFHATAAPNDPAALKLALETTIRNKGRLLDVMAEGVAALRQRLNPRDRTLLDQLIEARSQLSTLMLRWDSSLDPQQRQSEQKLLETRIEELEAEITTRSTRFNPPTAVTLEMLQAALPRDAKLVEFTTYRPNDDDTEAPLHYLAYVIAPQGTPTWVELGAAQPIDEAVKAFRASLRTPASAEVKQRARALDEKVMQPIRKLLGDTRHVLLSPDGALNLIPFAALVDEQNRYLVEQYSFTYLSSGRDLLRLQKNSANPQGQWIIADPDFGAAAKPEPTTTGLLDGAVFARLPGTADEARALQTILPQATVLTAEKATETALKQMTAPRLLHIATHGFFLDSAAPAAASDTLERNLFRGPNPGQPETPAVYVENPLLRSGLVLAGVATRKSGNDDGILTAMEVSGLNLLGTKLVTLSACDTGVGEVKNGNGVYGLRRALVLAGAETQVMSLWPVSDQGTRDLMIAYYQRLQAGEGRSEALRQAQLQMLKSTAQTEGDKRGVKPLSESKAAFAGRSHPYYWASFIQSGEWANLDGKR